MTSTEDISSCWQCGECCRGLAQGVRVTEQEWRTFRECLKELPLDAKTASDAEHSFRLPTIGDYESKKCIFLEDDNTCGVYEQRPEECKRFPIWTIEGNESVTIVISRICPRAEALAEYIRMELPDWVRELVKDRSYRVTLV